MQWFERFAMNRFDANSLRKFAAAICMFAFLLIYAPVASATFMVVTGSCCAGDQCPIHGHHHSAQHGNSDVAMDCGHEMSTMQSCTMSCCQDSQQPAVHANVYVLTPVEIASVLAPLALATLTLAPSRSSPAFTPLAPPPKTSAAILS